MPVRLYVIVDNRWRYRVPVRLYVIVDNRWRYRVPVRLYVIVETIHHSEQKVEMQGDSETFSWMTTEGNIGWQ